MADADLPELDACAVLAEVVRSRRTTLLVDPDEEVPEDLVELLIELATWAPNHKRTWPWRFTVLSGDARLRYGQALASVAPGLGLGPEKVSKLRVKYARSPVVVIVWVEVDADARRAAEDRDAVAAGVQNLLLGATSFGLGSYWASVPEALTDATRAFAGVGADHDPVALVYLGWPTGTVSVPPRPTPEVTWLD